MTTVPEHDLTRDLAALQRLPEDEQPPGVLDPTCATTGVTGRAAVSRPADVAPAAEPAAEPASKPAAKTAAKPAARPAGKPAAKPAAKPASKAAAKPASKAGTDGAERRPEGGS